MSKPSQTQRDNITFYKGIDTASVDSILAAYADLQRDWSGKRLLVDAFFSSANRFDEIVRDACETMLARELVLDYRPACAAPSFQKIQRCYDDLTQHLDKLGTPPACYGRLNRPWLFGLAQRSANLLAAVDWLVSESAKDDPDGGTYPAPANMPDFSHRLSPLGGSENTLALVDSVNMMASKAEAVLVMLGNAFAVDEDTDRPSDDAVFYALRSIGDEIADIKATVSAFHRQSKI